MRSDGFGYVWMRSEALGQVWKISEKSVQKLVFRFLDRFLRSYAETDVTSSFPANFLSGYTYLELDMTLGAHLGIVCRPGIASASPIGRLQGHSHGGGGVAACLLLILNGKN